MKTKTPAKAVNMEVTGKKVKAIAGRVLRRIQELPEMSERAPVDVSPEEGHPDQGVCYEMCTLAELRSLCASLLTQSVKSK
jgi:hypothetical protein